MKDTSDIPALISFVRKHQDFKSEAFKVGTFNYTSIAEWLNASEISKGPYPVRGAALRRLYTDWCTEKGIEKALVATKKCFHSAMKEVLNFHLKKDNLFFYVNKKVVYEPQKSKENDQAAQAEETSKKD